MTETHFVEVPCNCGNIQQCAMERYIADIRIAFEEIERLSQAYEAGRTVEMAAIAA